MLTNQSTQNVGSCSGTSSTPLGTSADEPPDLNEHKRSKPGPQTAQDLKNCWFAEKEAAQFREAVCPVVKTSSGQNGLDTGLKCAGCGHGAWNARQAKCSHLWCLTCVMKLITSNKDPCCPADRTKFCEGDLRVPAQGILDKLNKLKIVCPIHKAEGCQWQGLYQDASKHITECPKSVVSCPFGCNLRYLREESDKHLSAFGVTHTRVLSERLDNEARERRHLYALVSKLSEQVSALQKGQPIRVESQPVPSPVAAAPPKSQEGESRSSISLLPGDSDKNRQAMLNRLDDEEKKRAALGVLLVNEQKERLKLKNRLDDEHKERLALMRHVDLLSHQFSSIARSGEHDETLQTQETIVVFGGILDGHSTLDVVEVYNPATNTWTSMSPMLSPRWAFAAAPWKGRMIVMGGGILGKKSLHTAGLWSPVGDQWKRMPSMTCNRNGCAATTVNDVVYCFGGYDGKDQLTSAEKYDEKTYTWKKIADMSTRRRGCAAVCVSGRAYVMGGYDGRKRVSAMEVYDPNTDTWKQAPGMPTKRDGCAAAAVGDRIFVCGGYDGKVRLNNAEMYDVTSKQWKVLPNMNHRRDGCAAAVVDGRVYVFGGYDGKNWLESGEVYDPVTNAWKRTAPMLTKRSYCAAVTWIPLLEPTPQSASQLTINPNKTHGDHDSDSTSPGSPPHSPPHTPPLSAEIKQVNPNATVTSEMQRESVTLPPLHPGLNMIQSRSKDSISGGSSGGSPRSSSPLPLPPTVSAPVPVRAVSGELLSTCGSATSLSNMGTNGSNSPPSPSPQAEFNLLSPPERPDREPSFVSLSSLAGDPRLSLMSPSAAAASSAVSNPAPSPAHQQQPGNTKP